MSDRLFPRLMPHAARRADSEHEQAAVRVILGLLFNAYLYSVHFAGWLGGIAIEGVYIASIYLLGAVMLAALAFTCPQPSRQRRIAGILLDTIAITFALVIGGMITAALYGGYLWVTIANGLRYGRRYMYFANIASLAAFALVMALSDFWQQHLVLGLGLMIWLVLLPIYVAKLLRKLEAAVETANKASKAKSRFLANMSHEIRTPLTAIMGFSQSLLERGLVVGEGVDAAETISRNSKHLQHIIDEILDLSKIEAGKLEVEIIPTSLPELLEDIRATIEFQARQQGLDFVIDYSFPVPETINTDPLRIKEILLNLCNNAIKFTPEGSVRLTVAWESDAGQLTFSVLDTGIGMTPEQLNKVFSAFAQADSSTTRKFGGTGLGLTICRLLAARLGAKLSVDSRLGQGTRFELSLPQKNIDRQRLLETPSCTQTPGTAAEQSTPRLRGHVLLTDDSIDNQKLVSMYLEQAGLSVSIANNGEEAVEQALQGDFDLILMDMQMPVMDGLEATATLRDIGDNTPVVALTATAMKEDRLRCQQAGCDGFLAKPIDRQRFYTVLNEYLPEASTSGDKAGAGNGETDAFLELVRSFIDGLPAQLEEISAAQNGRAWQRLAAAAHKLKGMGGSFGHPELTELAAQLEVAAKRESADESQQLVTTLKQRVSALITEYSTPDTKLAAI